MRQKNMSLGDASILVPDRIKNIQKNTGKKSKIPVNIKIPKRVLTNWET